MLNESAKSKANPALSITVSLKSRLLLIVSFDSNSNCPSLSPAGDNVMWNLESFMATPAMLLNVPFANPNTLPFGPIILLPTPSAFSKYAVGGVLSIENASLRFMA